MLLQTEEMQYPGSDGEPMAEYDFDRIAMEYAEHALAGHFEADPLVYVSVNLFVYYERGNKKRRVAPDVFFVRGVPKRDRRNFLIWREGQVPQVVFEVTTESSADSDPGWKRDLYEAIGVEEYYAFDPLGEFLSPRFRAWRRQGQLLAEVSASDSIFSPHLGLEIRVDGILLRFFDPASKRLLPIPPELRAQVRSLESEVKRQRLRVRREKTRALRSDERARQAEDKVWLAEEKARLAEAEAREANEKARLAEAEAWEANERLARLQEEVERLRRERDPRG